MFYRKACLFLIFVSMVTGRNGDVRLSGGGATFKGRVEVLYKDNWNTVCDDEWTSSNTDVVCKQLDYDAGVKVASFGPGSGTILLDSVQCVGNEPNLLECRHNGFFNTNCKHTEDVGVECLPKLGDVQLVGGSTQGRVEVFNGSHWNTVCDDGWDDIDSTVVCRQLGFSTGRAVSVMTVTSNKARGKGIWLSEVKCEGTEKTLLECSYEQFNNNCQHVEDAAVTCGFIDNNRTMETGSQSADSNVAIIAGIAVPVGICIVSIVLICIAILVSVFVGKDHSVDRDPVVESTVAPANTPTIDNSGDDNNTDELKEQKRSATNCEDGTNEEGVSNATPTHTGKAQVGGELKIDMDTSHDMV